MLSQEIINEIHKHLAGLSPAKRHEFLREIFPYCLYCGYDLPCCCWNDE